MGGILWIILVGFIAGGIAKFLSPGPNNPSDPSSPRRSGAVRSSPPFIGQSMGHYSPDQGAGFITSTIGALWCCSSGTGWSRAARFAGPGSK